MDTKAANEEHEVRRRPPPPPLSCRLAEWQAGREGGRGAACVSLAHTCPRTCLLSGFLHLHPRAYQARAPWTYRLHVVYPGGPYGHGAAHSGNSSILRPYGRSTRRAAVRRACSRAPRALLWGVCVTIKSIFTPARITHGHTT